MAELWLVKGCDSGFFSCDEIDCIEWNGVLGKNKLILCRLGFIIFYVKNDQFVSHKRDNK